MFDAVEGILANERSEIDAFVVTATDLELRDALLQLRDKSVRGLLADGNGNRDGHATLAGAAVARADQGVGNLVEVGVRHDDRVVLGATEALCALAVSCGRLVDVLSDRRGADEADGLDAIVGEQNVDNFLVTVDHVEHTRGQSRFEEQLGQAQRDGGVTLGGLEDEGVTGGEGGAGLPQRDHRGEVEGRDAGNDAERLTHGVHVDAGAGTLGEFTLSRCGAPTANSMTSRPRWMSPLASATVLPCSDERRRARESISA